MKYVLGIIFEFKYYKNPANIKIFSNNRLIDDIDLTEDIKKKEMLPPTLHENTHLYDWWKTWAEGDKYFGKWKDGDFVRLPITDKVFVYTLDETVLQGSIKIEVTLYWNKSIIKLPNGSELFFSGLNSYTNDGFM